MREVSIKLSPLSSHHLVHQFHSSIPYFHLKTCSFLCLNTISNTWQSTFNSIAMKGKFKRRNFRGTFITTNLQRCVSFGRREWNGIKGIFLEYFSLLLFGSFNEGNGRFIPLFGSLSGREWNG